MFAYTNHTVLPEALERWPAELLGRLLPRHLELIEEIDRRFRTAVRLRYPGDEPRVARMAILGDDPGRSVRMAHLAIVGSHAVNGVARLHTEILRGRVFPEFDALFPGRFTSKTNGITPRRWLLRCNPALAALVTEAIGDGWVTDLYALRRAGAVRRRRAVPVSGGRRSSAGNKLALSDAHARDDRDPDSIPTPSSTARSSGSTSTSASSSTSCT